MSPFPSRGLGTRLAQVGPGVHQVAVADAFQDDLEALLAVGRHHGRPRLGSRAYANSCPGSAFGYIGTLRLLLTIFAKSDEQQDQPKKSKNRGSAKSESFDLNWSRVAVPC